MSKSVSLNKITSPSMPQVLPREHLFQRLEENLSNQAVWISGPAGSGKTCLVGSYIAADSHPCLWYQCDGGDADLATFFHYLSTAAQKTAPGNRAPLPLFTPEYAFGIAQFARTYFEELGNRLPSGCCIVFDNLQEIPDESPVHGFLLEGIGRLPEDISVIMISRKAPSPPFARLLANRRMTLFTWDDMRLSRDECQEIAQNHGLSEEASRAVEELYPRIDGWAAGFQLLLDMDRKIVAGDHHFHLEQPELVFDYFAGEVFRTLSDETRNLLLRVSWLPFMSVPMACELSGNEKAGRILADLHRANQFTEKRYAPEVSYQFHPLFREFLVNQSAEQLDHEDRDNLRKKAAAILEDNGFPGKAVDLLAAAAQWEELTRVIIDHAPAVAAKARFTTLADWINLLPQNLLDQNPWLLYWLATCRMPLNPGEARRHFEQAYALFRPHKDPEGTYLSWAGVADSYLHEWDDMGPLDHWITEMNAIQHDIPDVPSEKIEARVVYAMLAVLIFKQPYNLALATWIDRAEALLSRDIQEVDRLYLLVFLVMHQSWSGRTSQRFLYRSLLHAILEQGSDLPPLVELLACLASANAALGTRHHGECAALVQRGLETAGSTGVHILNSPICSQGVYAALASGDLQTAGQHLTVLALMTSPQRRMDLGHLYLVQGYEAAVRENLVEAEELIGKAIQYTDQCQSYFPMALVKMAMGWVLAESGRHDDARIFLEEAMNMGRKANSQLFEQLYQMIMASMAFDNDAEEAGQTHLESAFRIGREQEWIAVAFLLPRVILKLIRKAYELNVETDYAGWVLRTLHLSPQDPPLELEAWPWPLKIHTLGRFEMVKDGTPIRPSRKAQEKPLALLKALIAFGGRDVNQTQIADELWPDADGDQQHKALATTLYRLRQLLDDKEAVSLQEGRLSLNPKHCWVDVWAFERLADQAEKDWQEAPGSDMALKSMGQAMNIYRGAFLAAEDEHTWAIPMRDRLRSKLTRQVERLGKHYEEQDNWQEAAAVYQKGLETDPLFEDASLRLMRCHQKMGNRTEALAVFHRCRKMLGLRLGVEPSTELVDLYNSIKTLD